MLKNTLLVITIVMPFQIFSQVDSIALTTPEGITAKMLEFISFEKGEVKDWDEYRNLFLPGAHKISIRSQPGESLSKQVKIMNLEEFVRGAGETYARNGFEEIVIGLDVKEFNGIATVFQSFYCKTLDNSYEARGVNTYQLVYLNDRWWIASTLFTNESDTVKLPNDYLFKAYQTSKE